MMFGGSSMSLSFRLHVLIWVGAFGLFVICPPVLIILPIALE